MTFGDLRGRGREGDSIGQFIRRTATVFTAIEPRATQCAAHSRAPASYHACKWVLDFGETHTKGDTDHRNAESKSIKPALSSITQIAIQLHASCGLMLEP